MHLTLAGDRGGEVLTGAVFSLMPYLNVACQCGACCGYGGGMCWNQCNDLAMYPGM